MASKRKNGRSRREFITTAGTGIGAAAVIGGFPAIVPASVFGAAAPSNRINVGAIGMGRISRGHDLPGLLKYESARVMAACDLDSNRVEDAKRLIRLLRQENRETAGVTGAATYRQLLSPTRTWTPS